MPVFGGAKPVPINTRNLKNGVFSFALVALAGPLVNFVLAFVFYGVFLMAHTDWLAILASVGVSVNLGFMLFNIIPIPPLDGSRVFYALAPDFVREFMTKIERHGFIIIYLLILCCGTLMSRYIYGGEDLVLGWFDSFYGLFGL
jgi:Zn-dependent protease